MFHAPGGRLSPAPRRPGTIVIDTAHKFLFLVEKDGKALRYGVGVGREGFAWSGVESEFRARPNGRIGRRRRKC